MQPAQVSRAVHDQTHALQPLRPGSASPGGSRASRHGASKQLAHSCDPHGKIIISRHGNRHITDWEHAAQPEALVLTARKPGPDIVDRSVPGDGPAEAQPVIRRERELELIELID